MPSFRMQEYRCNKCGTVFESLEPRENVPKTHPCPTKGCHGVAVKCLSAVCFKQKLGWVTPAKWGTEERPPGTLDTRPIARRRGIDV